MRHPDVGLRRLVFQEARLSAQDLQGRAAVFAPAGMRNLATKCGRHCLESVANTEDRNTLLEQCRIDLRCTVGIHTRRPTRQDDCSGLVCHHFTDAGSVRHNFGEDLGLANAPSNQLRVLGPEINDEYFLILRHGSNPTGSGHQRMKGRRVAPSALHSLCSV